MLCRICNVKYDHSKNRPFILIPCTHTLCIRCLIELKEHKCPFCFKEITDQNANWTLLDIIPESNYDKLKTKLEISIQEAIHMKSILNESYEKKTKENINQFQLMRNQIITRTNEMIKTVQKCQKLLLSEVRKIENKVKNDLDKLVMDDTFHKEITKTKESLTKNDIDQAKLEQLKQEFHILNTNLSTKLINHEKANDYQYEFNSNEEFKIETKQIGEIKTKRNDSNAISRYIKAIETKLNNADLYIDKGLLFEKQKDIDAATSFYTKATEIDRFNDKAFYLKGKCLQMKKDYQKAIECFERAIELSPNQTIYYCFKGLCLKERKEYGAAIELYNKAIQLDPNNPDAYYGKGIAFIARKNYIRAVNCFTKAFELNPTEYDYLNKKADALFSMNNYEEAINCLNASLQVENTKNDYAFNLKGIIHFVQNNFDDSIDCFNKAIETGSSKNNSNYYFNKGYAYFMKKEFDKATFYYTKANEMNPNLSFSYYEDNANVTLFKQ